MVIEAFPPFDDGSGSNEKLDWWNRPNHKLSYAEYTINPFTKILVGNRPNYDGTNESFYNSVDAWINVSDRYVRHRKGTVSVFLPWNEAGIPSYETLFSVLKTLHYYVSEQKLSKIYIHCDGGTHRAVSMLGFYLLAYHPDRAEEINNSKVLVDREVWSNPLEYARTYLKDIPLLPEFLKAIGESQDSVSHGHSLEDFLKGLLKPELLFEYRRQRFISRDLPAVWADLKWTVWFALRRQTIGRWDSLMRWGHKKLNTKKGQQLKKMGF